MIDERFRMIAKFNLQIAQVYLESVKMKLIDLSITIESSMLIYPDDIEPVIEPFSSID